MRNRAIAFSALLTVCLSAQAAVINVPGEEPTIQDGVDAATDGDTVLIAGGTYNLSSPIEVDGNELGGKNITLRGDGKACGTILSGGSANTLLIVQNVTGSGLIVDSLGFEKGQATETFHGGCAVFQNSVGTITNSRFESCESDPGNTSNSGGAIKISNGSDVSVQSSTFLSNRSHTQGGAIHVLGATASIENSTFSNNVARGGPTSGGGGVKLTNGFGGKVVISQSAFNGNEASFAGGAVSIFDGNADLIANTFDGNGQARFGGAVHFETDTTGRVLVAEENLFRNNVALDRDDPNLTSSFDEISGGAMHINSVGDGSGSGTNSTVTLRDNRFEGNSSIDSRCDSDNKCGVGGAIEMLWGFENANTIAGNTFQGNQADVYGAAVFDKTRIRFVDNVLSGNQAQRAHPGMGCVSDRYQLASLCIIERNRFVENTYTGAGGTGNSNDVGALNIRRTAVQLHNNLFVRNDGFYGTVFIRHEDDTSDDSPVLLFSSIKHNTFVDNTLEKTSFGTVRIQGEGTLLNNNFDGDYRALRADDFTTSTESVISQNNFIDQMHSVARAKGTVYPDVASLNSKAFANSNVSIVPQYFDPGNDDYDLSEGSALVDQVSCPPDVTIDILSRSRPFGSACDIGSFEYTVDGTIFADRFES